MRDVVRAKFTQHTHILSILLGTGDALIVEHTANGTTTTTIICSL